MSEHPWASRIVRLEHVAPDQLLANPANARRHPGAQRDALRSGLSAVGWVAPVISNLRTGNLIDGHARIEEAISAGLETVPVAYVDLSEDEEAVALATLDPIGELAIYDTAALDALVAGLPDDLDETLRRMLLDLETKPFDEADLETPKPAVDPDEMPEDVPAITQPGDLWVLGAHRVLCGSSCVPEDVALLMDGRQADIVWTDPPYGVDYQGGAAGNRERIANDKPEDLAAVLAGGFDAVLASAKPGAAVYVASPSGPQTLEFGQALHERGMMRQRLVWAKDSLVLGHSDYHYQHEDIYFGYVPGYTGRRGRGGDGWFGDHAQTSLLHFPKPSSSDAHPTMKPVALILYCLANSSRRGDLVLDVFGGSGSTLIAAQESGRVAYLVELMPKYVDAICRRWQGLTGLLPVLERTGEHVSFISS